MNRMRVVGTFLLTRLVLAGCSVGQTGSPNLDRARIGLDSVDAQVGRLRLLSVAIVSPGGRGSLHLAGDSAGLFVTIANDGGAEDVSPDAPLQAAVPAGGTVALREVTRPHLELSGLEVPIRTYTDVRPDRFVESPL